MDRPSAKELRRLYEDEGLSRPAIGLRYGVSNSTVCRWFQTTLIPRRSTQKPLPVSVIRLREMYLREQLTPAEIKAIVGQGTSTIMKKLRQAGIPMRTRSDAQKVAIAKRRSFLPPPHPGNSSNLMKWQQEHPEEVSKTCQKANRISAYRRSRIRRWYPCGWCGAPVSRTDQERRSYSFSACNNSHSVRWIRWRSCHPDEPRPLLLARLRELAGEDRSPDRLRRMAEEIGAGDIEVAEILFPTEAA
jgi:hypothetical protein